MSEVFYDSLRGAGSTSSFACRLNTSARLGLPHPLGPPSAPESSAHLQTTCPVGAVELSAAGDEGPFVFLRLPRVGRAAADSLGILGEWTFKPSALPFTRLPCYCREMH